MVEKAMPVVPPLHQLYIYVTDRCNCSCKHCWIVPERSGASPGKGHFLSPECFEAAVGEAIPLGLKAVKWTGGEPTIHPRFPELLQRQKRLGIKGRLETNGIEVTPSLARLLFDSGVEHVAVSLDGREPETHDAIRSCSGAHRRAVTGIKNLVTAGFRPQIIMSLMRENCEEVEPLLDLARDLGAGSVKLNIIQPTLRGEAMQRDGAALSIPELLSLNRKIHQELRHCYTFPIFFDIPMAFRPLGSIINGDGCSVCGIKTILGLLADGSYALCGIGVNLPELVFGTAGKGDLGSIWREHPLLAQIRTEIPSGLRGVCGSCLMKSVCLGACIAQNFYRTRNLYDSHWFCSGADKEGFFPKVRVVC